MIRQRHSLERIRWSSKEERWRGDGREADAADLSSHFDGKATNYKHVFICLIASFVFPSLD